MEAKFKEKYYREDIWYQYQTHRKGVLNFTTGDLFGKFRGRRGDISRYLRDMSNVDAPPTSVSACWRPSTSSPGTCALLLIFLNLTWCHCHAAHHLSRKLGRPSVASSSVISLSVLPPKSLLILSCSLYLHHSLHKSDLLISSKY